MPQSNDPVKPPEPKVFAVLYRTDDCIFNGPFIDAEAAIDFVMEETRFNKDISGGGVFTLNIWPVRS